MNFQHAKTANGDVYLCGEFKMESHPAGFGMEVVDIYRNGKFAYRTSGHNAVSDAKRWVRRTLEREAPIPEMDLAKTADER